MNTAESAALHIVDDEDRFRTGVVRLMAGAGWPAIGYRCAGEFLIRQSGEVPGSILLDISMPGPRPHVHLGSDWS